MALSESIPRLRPVEIMQLPGQSGRPVICLRDRLDPSAEPLLISREGLLLASLFDGERSVSAVRAAFAVRTGVMLSVQEIQEFVEQLDRAYLLDSPRAHARLERLREEFHAAPLRAPVHAGGAYPSQPDELVRFLEALYRHPHGPGGPPAPREPRPRLVGLIAPHIDLHRGGPVYARAYRALAEAEAADLYVLLGTCHAGLEGLVAATPKAYDTPLGAVPTDVEFLNELCARYGENLYREEFLHRAEHSLEFQALYLRFLELAGGDGRARCAPILCNALQLFVPPGTRPAEVVPVASFVRALRETIAASGKRVCLVAGADLAHVGPQFGDPRPLDDLDLARVGAGDQEMLQYICAGDAEGFYLQVMRDLDARRICGLAPIYLTLATVGRARGQLLRYEQWVDPSRNGCVTYAAVTLEPLSADSAAP